MRENVEKRYLNTWHYNAALILTELENIVKNNGGELCATWEYNNPPMWLTDRKQYLITNRSLSEIIHKEEEMLSRLENLGRADAARETREKIAQYKAMCNDPILTFYADYLYINFVIDGYFYSFSMDRNPFFEFYFAKVKIEDENRINRNYFLQEDRKEWLYDCFFRVNCSNADRREAANLICNMLLNADCNRKYNDKKRKPYTNIVLIKEDGEQ